MELYNDQSNPAHKDTVSIIKYWYKKLSFPTEYDPEFNRALAEIPVSDAITAANYDWKETDGRKNLLSILYMCENLKEAYEQKGIPESILYDTLQDVVHWTITWSNLKKELYLGELMWLRLHLGMRLFKIGRLQFCMGNSHHTVAGKIEKSDPIMEVHIPATGPLNMEDCKQSIEMAKTFFAKYYPEYGYKYFTCHSWLLDPTLSEVLDPGSNILKFQQLYEITQIQPSDAILKYVFEWDTIRSNMHQYECKSRLAESARRYIDAGGSFCEAFGIFPR